MQNIIAEYINTYQETIQIALQKHDEITGMGGTIAPYGFFVVILFCVAGAISGIVLRKAWISSRRGYQKVEGLFAFIIGMIYAFLATAVALSFEAEFLLAPFIGLFLLLAVAWYIRQEPLVMRPGDPAFSASMRKVGVLVLSIAFLGVGTAASVIKTDYCVSAGYCTSEYIEQVLANS